MQMDEISFAASYQALIQIGIFQRHRYLISYTTNTSIASHSIYIQPILLELILFTCKTAQLYKPQQTDDTLSDKFCDILCVGTFYTSN